MDTKSLLIEDEQRQVNHVLKVFNKTQGDLEEDIQILKEWLKNQPHLPEMPSDRMIRNFLFSTKFSIESSKQKIDMYYTLRPLIPELYQNKNPKLPHMQDVRKQVYVCPLPKLTKEGYRVTIIKVLDGNVDNFDAYNFLAHIYNTAEIRIQEDVPLSDITVTDFEFVKIGHTLKLTPASLKKASVVLEKVFSNRLKAMHLINAPPYIDGFVTLIKQLLPPKLGERIYVHTKPNAILQYLPKDILPKDFGGDEMPLSELNDLWRKKMEEYESRFDALETMWPKEELRPAPLKNDEILGFYGNFKKLSVD